MTCRVEACLSRQSSVVLDVGGHFMHSSIGPCLAHGRCHPVPGLTGVFFFFFLQNPPTVLFFFQTFAVPIRTKRCSGHCRRRRRCRLPQVQVERLLGATHRVRFRELPAAPEGPVGQGLGPWRGEGPQGRSAEQPAATNQFFFLGDFFRFLVSCVSL